MQGFWNKNLKFLDFIYIWYVILFLKWYVKYLKDLSLGEKLGLLQSTFSKV